MSVRVANRKKTTFEVVVKADNLALYTLEILSNDKVFFPGYEQITDRISEHVLRIGEDLFEANKIRVENRSHKERRAELQSDALSRCKTLTYLITLAKRAFKLRSRRVEYWTGLVLDLEDSITRWRESDARRYADV